MKHLDLPPLHGSHRWRLPTAAVLAALLVVSIAPTASAAGGASGSGARSYSNPLDVQSDVGPVENCADPTVTRAQRAEGDWRWYMYCTKDPRNDDDRLENGDYDFQLIPMYRSRDLVHWHYQGNVFDEGNYPSWAQPDAGLFAPEIKRMNGQWYLYYSVTDVTDATSGEPGCTSDSAIGVATGPSPLGPWTDSGDPVVDPRRNSGPPGCDFFATIDPEVRTVNGQRYIFFGSYFGGVFARELDHEGLESDAAASTRITPGNKYEGPEIIRHDGYFYLFVSATDCCRQALTGYSVFAGRSRDIVGPYRDRDGVSLLEFDTIDKDPFDGRIGGTPVLSMNGNRWVGPGHNTVFRDFSGRHWTIYHAVDLRDPSFADAPDFTKRPPLMDAIEWIDGWPQVRSGRWASTSTQPAPAAQPGQRDLYHASPPKLARRGDRIERLSDEFDGSELEPGWAWIRGESAQYEVSGGLLRWDTQDADLFEDSNNASVLYRDAPAGDWMLEARIRLTVPAEACCFNFRQGGLVAYGGDDAYIKLSHTSIFETRQTEYAKEIPPPQPTARRYGNTVIGPPGEWTTLRIVKSQSDRPGRDRYEAWTKRDGDPWVRGGTWRHDLGETELLGLVSMGGPDYQTQVDWFRVYRVEYQR